MRLPSLIRLVVFIVIGAVPVAGQVQAQRLNIDAFLQQWDTDHDGTLSVDEIKKAALAPALLCFIVALSASPFKSKSRLEAENAALRHQLMVLRRKVHGRVRLTNNDRLFFIQLYRWFSVGPEGHHDHPSRDARPLASSRLSPLLASEIALSWR